MRIREHLTFIAGFYASTHFEHIARRSRQHKRIADALQVVPILATVVIHLKRFYRGRDSERCLVIDHHIHVLTAVAIISQF